MPSITHSCSIALCPQWVSFKKAKKILGGYFPFLNNQVWGYYSCAKLLQSNFKLRTLQDKFLPLSVYFKLANVYCMNTILSLSKHGNYHLETSHATDNSDGSRPWSVFATENIGIGSVQQDSGTTVQPPVEVSCLITNGSWEQGTHSMSERTQLQDILHKQLHCVSEMI